MKFFKKITIVIVLVLCGFFVYNILIRHLNENKLLKQIIFRLEADTRIAEALVTNVSYNESEGKTYTTIKFLEYNVNGDPLEPKYFTFSGNIIQFQSLVLRFEDIHIRYADKLKGKSLHLFWKVFMLDGKNTQEYIITNLKGVPSGYALDGSVHEGRIWKRFWDYALDPGKAGLAGIKNAQIEAPGTMFLPGTLYTIKIEHDGGIRIDASALPGILKGERIL
ncbi:MAG: hypothetical protein PHQ54_05285 [Candidatus Omnitrophica bacterium]|nr:hypothetical protein [Candidatus Omnitrophota bacterium]